MFKAPWSVFRSSLNIEEARGLSKKAEPHGTITRSINNFAEVSPLTVFSSWNLNKCVSETLESGKLENLNLKYGSLENKLVRFMTKQVVSRILNSRLFWLLYLFDYNKINSVNQINFLWSLFLKDRYVNIPKMEKVYFQSHVKKAERRPNFKPIQKNKVGKVNKLLCSLSLRSKKNLRFYWQQRRWPASGKLHWARKIVKANSSSVFLLWHQYFCLSFRT